MEENSKKWEEIIGFAVFTLFVGFILGTVYESYHTKNHYFAYCKPAVEKVFGELTEGTETKAFAFGEDFIVIKKFLGDSSKAIIIRTPHIIGEYYDDFWKDKYISTIGEKYYGKSTGYFEEIEDIQAYWKALVKEHEASMEFLKQLLKRMKIK